LGSGGHRRNPDHGHRHAWCSCCGEPVAQGEASRSHPGHRRHGLPEHHGESIAVVETSEQPGAWWRGAADHGEPVADAADRTITVSQTLAVSLAVAVTIAVTIAEPEPEYHVAVA
jgi:hypothetical protein